MRQNDSRDPSLDRSGASMAAWERSLRPSRSTGADVDRPTSPECAQLKALIEAIDAAARQPLPAFRQDQLKDERRRAHDRRFALRCG